MNTHFQFLWTVNRIATPYSKCVFKTFKKQQKRLWEYLYHSKTKGWEHFSWLILVGVQWYLLLLAPTNDVFFFFIFSFQVSTSHFTTKSTSYSSPWGRWHFLPQLLSSFILGSPWGPDFHGRGSTLACCIVICWWRLLRLEQHLLSSGISHVDLGMCVVL